MARRFTRRPRWRRPERMTLEHPPVARRKDIGAPAILMLEPDLERRAVRRKLAAMLATYGAAAGIEGLAVGWALGSLWVAAVFAGIAVAYAAGARRFGGTWIRRVLGAEPARNPRLNRLTRSVAEAAGVPPPDALIVRAEGTNGFAVGLHRPAVVATTGSLNVDDLTLEGVVAHEVVLLRDGDAGLASMYITIAGVLDFLKRNVATPAGPLLLLGLLLWPAALVVRVARRAWFDPEGPHRADVAAALLTRYPPGVETALRGTRGAPRVLGVAEPFWFSTDASRRADLVAEM